jgi:S1-C subfamily serine protease
MLRRTVIVALVLLATTTALPLTAAEDEHRPAELGVLLTMSRSAANPAKAWLVVRGVGPGTPAERAGLRTGDFIVEIAGQPIAFKNDLEMLLSLAKLEPGKPVHFTVVRDRKRQDVELVPRRMSGPQYEGWKADLAALQARTKAASH